jgi:D-glycero-D-manno-heptose 1,7-bisphosphate phosphatase
MPLRSSVIPMSIAPASQLSPSLSSSRSPSLARAVFLDKDGTLIKDVPYNVDPRQIQFTEGAIAGLQALHTANYVLIVITNQSGVARGYFPESALLPVEQHLRSQLAMAGVPLRGFYYCPHHPDGVVASYAIACDCRKPQPGLLYQAAADLAIDLSQSWLIGDILHDVAAGRAAGCCTILLDNGNETEWQLSPQRLPHYIVADLQEAAQLILAVDPNLSS